MKIKVGIAVIWGDSLMTRHEGSFSVIVDAVDLKLNIGYLSVFTLKIHRP